MSVRTDISRGGLFVLLLRVLLSARAIVLAVYGTPYTGMNTDLRCGHKYFHVSHSAPSRVMLLTASCRARGSGISKSKRAISKSGNASRMFRQVVVVISCHLEVENLARSSVPADG